MNNENFNDIAMILGYVFLFLIAIYVISLFFVLIVSCFENIAKKKDYYIEKRLIIYALDDLLFELSKEFPSVDREEFYNRLHKSILNIKNNNHH